MKCLYDSVSKFELERVEKDFGEWDTRARLALLEDYLQFFLDRNAKKLYSVCRGDLDLAWIVGYFSARDKEREARRKLMEENMFLVPERVERLGWTDNDK